MGMMKKRRGRGLVLREAKNEGGEDGNQVRLSHKM